MERPGDPLLTREPPPPAPSVAHAAPAAGTIVFRRPAAGVRQEAM